MRIARIITTAGGALACIVLGRVGFMAVEPEVAGGWLWLLALGAVMIAAGAGYMTGRADGAAAEAAYWRRRRSIGFLATRSPAAGRPGASLTTEPRISPEAQPGRRVGDGEPEP